MLEVISLASYSFFGGGTLGEVLAQWQAAGVFEYALPFLLIFAMVYGILAKMSIFTETNAQGQRVPAKTINAILALATALMALQFDFVNVFFSQIFPRMGVALSVILVILVLGGLFMPENSAGFNWFIIGTVMVVIGFVIFNSFDALGYTGGFYWFTNNLDSLIGVVVFIGLVLAVVAGGAGGRKTLDNPQAFFIGNRK